MELSKAAFKRIAVRIGLGYALIAQLWLARAPAQPPAASPSDPARPEPIPPLPPVWQSARTPVLIFLALSSAIGGLGYGVYAHQKHALRKATAEALLTIADYQVEAISHWLAVQRATLEFFTRDPLLAQTSQRWLLAQSPAAEDGQRLQTWLATLTETFAYTGVLLLDREGQIRLSAGAAQLHPKRQALARQALASGQLILSELHWRHEVVGNPIELDLMAPLGRLSAGGQRPFGALVVQIDPAQYLFPLLQTWPTTSPTGETLLVRREGEDVVYLNELRHRRNTALQLRMPLASEHLPAALAIRGERGVIEGFDYRQVPVLAALRAVPDTAWFVVAKIDAEEVYAPLRTLMRLVAGVGSLLIMAAGTGTALWWRRRHAGFVVERLQHERQRQALVQRFDYLSKYANDSILLMDSQGQLLEANERAVAAYGYAQEELLGLNIRDLRAPEAREQAAEQMTQATQAEGWVFETVHQRQDGTRFPVEVSARRIALQGQSFLQSIIRDISERQQAEERLRYQLHLVQSIADQAAEAIFVTDTQGRVTFLNAEAERTFGFAAGELTAQRLHDKLHHHYPDGRLFPISECPMNRVYTVGEKVRNHQAVFFRKDGLPVAVECSNAPLERNGQRVGAVLIVRDITERQRAEAALVEETERLRVTLHSIGDGVITTDAEGRVRYLNPVAETLTGWSVADAQGQPLPQVFAILDEESRQPVPDPVARCLAEGGITKLDHPVLLRSRSEREYLIQDSAAPIRDATGKVVGVVLVFSDVTKRRRLARSIIYQATHDSLTGLVNRSEFERRLQRVLEVPQQERGKHALCYLDLDQFKVVNDTCGHAAGDKLLQQLSDLFKAQIRTRDTLARLGGDEFGVLLEHCSVHQALRVAETLRQAVEKFRFTQDDKLFRIGVSIGLVPIDHASGNLKEVLSAADAACYLAKDQGRNRIHVYQADEVALTRRHGEIRWAVRIPHALEENHFRLCCQPIAPLHGRGQTGAHYELLLRLEDNGQLILPGAFLAAAERYNLAAQLDRWVIHTALRWLGQHPALLQQLSLCSINLSGQSLGEETLLAFILAQVKTHGIPPEKLCFEITETVAITNLANASRLIEVLKAEGCRFALDDFGSGLSSFAYLKTLPVDYLKIDGTFIKDIATDPIDYAIVKSMHEIAQVTGKQTIAEWVEDEPILAKLREIGVHYAQGYFIGRPRPWQEPLH